MCEPVSMCMHAGVCVCMDVYACVHSSTVYYASLALQVSVSIAETEPAVQTDVVATIPDLPTEQEVAQASQMWSVGDKQPEAPLLMLSTETDGEGREGRGDKPEQLMVTDVQEVTLLAQQEQ